MSAKKKPMIPQLVNSATTRGKGEVVRLAAANMCWIVTIHRTTKASPPIIPVSLNSSSKMLCTGNALIRLIIVWSYCPTTVTNEFKPTPKKGLAFTMYHEVEARFARKERDCSKDWLHRSRIVCAFITAPQVNTRAIKPSAIRLGMDNRKGFHNRQKTPAKVTATAKPAHPLRESVR